MPSSFRSMTNLADRKTPVYIVINVELKTSYIVSNKVEVAKLIGRAKGTICSWMAKKNYHFDKKRKIEIYKAPIIIKGISNIANIGNLKPNRK